MRLWKRKDEDHLRLYRENPETHRVIIEIALDRYMDYFHEWDNAVFRKRDLHPELAEFLDLCSEEIPLRRELEIDFCIKNRFEDIDKGKLIVASYRNYYNGQLSMIHRRLKRLLKFALILFFISMGFITFYLVGKSSTHYLIERVLVEGLLIGGWVFMWESLHMVFFESMEPMKRRRELKRFLQAEITFRSTAPHT